jgi:hypothetical protein
MLRSKCRTCGGTGKGIKRVSPNDLRRTFASWLKQGAAVVRNDGRACVTG